MGISNISHMSTKIIYLKRQPKLLNVHLLCRKLCFERTLRRVTDVVLEGVGAYPSEYKTIA